MDSKEWASDKKFNPFNSDKLLTQVYRWRKVLRGHPIPQPALVTVDPANMCNLKCIWCNAGYILDHNSGMLSRNSMIELADFLSSWKPHTDWEPGVEAVCVAGGGEPLVNPHTGEFIDRCAGNGIEVGVVTNGTLIDKFLDPLSKCVWVGVSVDAGNAKTFETLKKRDNFDKVISNMSDLVDKSHRESSRLSTDLQGYGVTYKYLLHPDNVSDVSAAIKIAKEIGCKNFHLRPAGDPWDKQDESEFAPIEFTEDHFKSLFEQVESCRHLEDKDFGIFSITHKFGTKLEKANEFAKCHAIFMTFVVSPSYDDEGKFNLGVCCDRRGDDLLTLGEGLTSIEDIDRLWGGDKHWDIFDNIKISECPRCLLPGTEILTKDSLKNIEDVKEEEEVITHSGKFREVKHVEKRHYDGDIVKITPYGNYEPICLTSNHKLPVVELSVCEIESLAKRGTLCKASSCSYMKSFMDRTGKEAFCDEPYKDIFIEDKKSGDIDMQKDFLLIPKFSPEKSGITVDADKMWLTGLYLAEGTISKHSKRESYCVNFHLSSGEDYMVNDISDKVYRVFNAKLHKPYFRDGSMTISFTSKKAHDYFNQFGRGAKNKSISNWVFDCDEESQKCLIKAYFIGDGHFGDKKQGVSATSSSKKLLLQIRVLLTRFGMTSSIYKSDRKNGGVIKGRLIKCNGSIFTLRINQRHSYVYEFFDQYDSQVSHCNMVHPKKPIEWGNYWLIGIKDIKTEKYSGDVWNMEVDIDHTYVVGNVVVNNCTYQPHNKIFEQVIQKDNMTYRFI